MPYRGFLVSALTVGLFGWGAQARLTSGSPQLIVRPESALFDAAVNVQARTGSPDSLVTLEARAEIDGRSYRSWASYPTDAAGAVDLAVAAPLAGTYTGVDPMGLFWSMQPIKNYGYAPPSLAPINVRLTLYTRAGSASVLVTRARIATDVARIALRGKPIVGTLFLPGKSTARGVVIVLGGSEGGVDENRAAIIASHGFATLALAYFGMDGLPSELANIPLEYVERGIAWVHERPETRNLPLILEGDSKGAELALLVAARDPLVRGVVAFAPSDCVFEGFSTTQGVQRASWTISGTPVPFADNPIPPEVRSKIRADRAAKRPVSFREQYLALATPAVPKSTIAVEKISGPLLLIAGADDQLWPSDVFARRIIEARKANGVKFADELLVFPAAGHEIDVPYMPTSDLAVFDEGSFRLAVGGSASGYARADASMWPKVLAFLDRLSTSAADPAPSSLHYEVREPFQPAFIDRSVPDCSATRLRCL